MVSDTFSCFLPPSQRPPSLVGRGRGLGSGVAMTPFYPMIVYMGQSADGLSTSVDGVGITYW